MYDVTPPPSSSALGTDDTRPCGPRPADAKSTRDFERCLLDKRSRHEGGKPQTPARDTTSAAPLLHRLLRDPRRHDREQGDETASRQPALSLGHSQPPTASTPAADAPGPRDTTAAVSKAIEAQRLAMSDPPPAGPLSVETPCSFELSLNEPLGVALSLRATRDGVQGPHALAGWSLSIAASASQAAALRHHAPRLQERLRARGLGDESVRVDAASDDSPALPMDPPSKENTS